MSQLPKWKPLTSQCRDALGLAWTYRLESADGQSAWEFTPQEAADIIGASIDREVKGADLGLPAEYADWVEVLVAPEDPGSEYVEVGSRHHRVASVAFLNTTQVGRQRYFVPPKPKPTLPDVGVGGVIRYTDHSGDTVRVMRTEFSSPGWVDQQGNTYSDDAVLCDVNADGFRVELGGLG